MTTTMATAESQGLLWRDSFVEGLSPLSFFVHAAIGLIGFWIDQMCPTRHCWPRGPRRGCDEHCAIRLLDAPRCQGDGEHNDRAGGYPMQCGLCITRWGIPREPEYDYTVRDGTRVVQFRSEGLGLVSRT